MRRTFAVAILAATMLTSCVSKKKYVALEEDYNDTRSSLQKSEVENEELEAKLDAIESRVSDYNSKINSLKDENDQKLEMNDLTAMSNANKEAMRQTLRKMDPDRLTDAQTLEDSINLAVAYNLEGQIGGGSSEDVEISVDKTVVMINVSDKLLFRSGSSRVSRDAFPLLQKLADVINSEPSMEVMVEGHTDSQTMVENSYLIDNWDLSVRRSTAIVRLLQDRFDVDPAKLIAAGRSSYKPLVSNDSAENRAKNRRTRIVILPNLDKFLALLDSDSVDNNRKNDMNMNQENEMK